MFRWPPGWDSITAGGHPLGDNRGKATSVEWFKAVLPPGWGPCHDAMADITITIQDDLPGPEYDGPSVMFVNQSE